MNIHKNPWTAPTDHEASSSDADPAGEDPALRGTCWTTMLTFGSRGSVEDIFEFENALAVSRQRLEERGMRRLGGWARQLAARREIVRVVAALRDTPIEEALRDAPERATDLVCRRVDAALDPARGGWAWSDPARWPIMDIRREVSRCAGRAPEDRQVADLVLSRSACVVHFQARSLEAKGVSLPALMGHLERARRSDRDTVETLS